MSWCLFCHFPLAKEHRMVFWADQVLSLKSSSVYCSLLISLRRTSLLQFSEKVVTLFSRLYSQCPLHRCYIDSYVYFWFASSLSRKNTAAAWWFWEINKEKNYVQECRRSDLSLYYSLTITATSWMFNVTERNKEKNYQCFCVFLPLDKDSGGRKDNFRHVCI